MNKEARSIRCPEGVLGWIPWYAETDERGDWLLDSRQRGAVESHASQCADCREELDMVAGVPFEIDVDLPDPDRVFDEITARIDAGEAEGADPSPVLPRTASEAHVVPIEAGGPMTDDEVRRLTRWVLAGEAELDERSERSAEAGYVVRRPWLLRPVQAAAAAAALFVIGLLGGSAVQNPFGAPESPAEYVLSTDASTPTQGPLLDVVFVEGVTAGEVGEGLLAAGLKIVSGPSSLRRYRLRATGLEGGAAEAELQVIAARLKEGPAPLAVLAEPVSPR